MKWIISHKSALEIWRTTPARIAVKGKRLRVMKPSNKPLDTNELRIEKFQNLSRPLHILVGSKNARKASKSLHCHISLAEIPDWSFIRMPNGLIVSSPELCFLQMASELSFIDLVMLGYEFCGSYRINKENKSQDVQNKNKGFSNNLPLTSTSKLSSYAIKAVNLKGCKKARRAIDFIVDGSASPMETILTMFLTLPYRFGGYGFPKPILNFGIDMPSSNVDSYTDYPILITVDSTGIKTSNAIDTLANKSKYYCDLYWPDKKVSVEYDSDEYHTGTYRIEKDAIRRNALASANITVVTASRRQVNDTDKLRELAEVLSKLLKKRLTYAEAEFKHRHAILRDQLMPKLPMNK